MARSHIDACPGSGVATRPADTTGHPRPGGPDEDPSARLTVGVEEEFLLVEADTATAAARAEEVEAALEPWLPTLQAMTANSPVYAGRDTGHASWRSVLWARWPSTGPTPYFRDLREYRATIERMIATGVMLDEGMTYWYARPSARYPTVEVRVGDVCPTADDATLVAALIRALVATLDDDIRAGRTAPRVPDGLLAAAHWRAAHDGLEGEGVDPVTGVVSPAWQLVDRLVARVEPALVRHGDLDVVTDLLDLLRRRGSGAERQRQARHDGGLREVLALLARQTSDS
jgi:carboxylate-amine ligase